MPHPVPGAQAHEKVPQTARGAAGAAPEQAHGGAQPQPQPPPEPEQPALHRAARAGDATKVLQRASGAAHCCSQGQDPGRRRTKNSQLDDSALLTCGWDKECRLDALCALPGSRSPQNKHPMHPV